VCTCRDHDRREPLTAEEAQLRPWGGPDGAVFGGKVTSVHYLDATGARLDQAPLRGPPDPARPSVQPLRVVYTFAPEFVVQGTADGPVEIVTNYFSVSYGARFEVGSRYEVDANPIPTTTTLPPGPSRDSELEYLALMGERLQTGSCSGNRPLPAGPAGAPLRCRRR
jgi:hypothetical protein